MRLKENTSNWRARGLQNKVKELPGAVRGGGKKKKTKLWCKGKVGVKHDYQVTSDSTFLYYRFIESKCTNCSKKKVEITNKPTSKLSKEQTSGS